MFSAILPLFLFLALLVTFLHFLLSRFVPLVPSDLTQFCFCFIFSSYQDFKQDCITWNSLLFWSAPRSRFICLPQRRQCQCWVYSSRKWERYLSNFFELPVESLFISLRRAYPICSLSLSLTLWFSSSKTSVFYVIVVYVSSFADNCL